MSVKQTQTRGFDSKRPLFITVRNVKPTVSYSNLATFLTYITLILYGGKLA